MNLTNIQQWDLGEVEVGFYGVKPSGSSRGALPLYIPKLMPQAAVGGPPPQPHIIDKTCFANDKKCEPALAKVLALQTHKTVPFQSNRYFRNPYMKLGARVYVEIHNGSPDTMYISTKEDNSVV